MRDIASSVSPTILNVQGQSFMADKTVVLKLNIKYFDCRSVLMLETHIATIIVAMCVLSVQSRRLAYPLAQLTAQRSLNFKYY
jgi:hypothetical protein